MKRNPLASIIAFLSALLISAVPHALGDTGPVAESTRIFDGPGFEMNGRFSPDGRLIAYQSEFSGQSDIYVGDLETGKTRRLTNTPDSEGRPAWSADGHKLAFHSNRSGNWDIWVMDADGENTWRLTDGPGDDISPHWSSLDEIVYQSDVSGSWDLWTAPATGGRPRQLTTHEGNEWHPRWSPDGRQVIFYTTWVAWTDLWIVSAKDGALQELSISEFEDYFPNWDPNGRSVIFSSDRTSDGVNSGGQIWSMPTAGGIPKALTDFPGSNRFAELSPDGTRMLVTRDHSVSNLQIVNVRTGISRLLPLGEASYHRPDFTPDGRALVFRADLGVREWHLFRLDLERNDIEQLTQGRRNHESIRPHRDGSRFAFVAGAGDYISYELFTMPTNGGTPKRVTQLGNVRFPEWCGDQLAFSHSPTSYTDTMQLYITDEKNGEPKLLLDRVVIDSPTDCSPDGHDIVFAIEGATGRDLYTMPIIGGELRRITNREGYDGDGVWSPDGQQLAFVSDRGGDREIHILSFDGNNVRQLTDDKGEALSPQWSPDGDSIVYARRLPDMSLQLLDMH